MIIVKRGRIKIIEGPGSEVRLEAIMILHAIYETVKETLDEERAEEELEKIVTIAKMSLEELRRSAEVDEHAN